MLPRSCYRIYGRGPKKDARAGRVLVRLLLPVLRRTLCAGGTAMKSYSSIFVIVLLLLIVLAGCAPGPNPSKKMAGEHAEIAGFWLGVWHGLTAPVVFVASLFRATSISTRSTTMELGTTSDIYSGWRASSEGAATGHRGPEVGQGCRCNNKPLPLFFGPRSQRAAVRRRNPGPPPSPTRHSPGR